MSRVTGGVMRGMMTTRYVWHALAWRPASLADVRDPLARLNTSESDAAHARGRISVFGSEDALDAVEGHMMSDHALRTELVPASAAGVRLLDFHVESPDWALGNLVAALTVPGLLQVSASGVDDAGGSFTLQMRDGEVSATVTHGCSPS